MRALSPDAFGRPVELVVRLQVLEELELAEAAARTLRSGTDPEALHDFRVALRRLRSLLRAFREELGRPASKKIRRELGALARATSSGRDAEVGLSWLQDLGPPARPVERAGFEAVRAALARQLAAAIERVEQEVLPAFQELAPRLRRRLARLRLELDLTDGTDFEPHRSYRSTLLERTLEQRVRLESSLDQIVDCSQEDEAHRTRIEAKRLRYLLEPAATHLPGGLIAVRNLRQLQDALGAFQDLNVLGRLLVEELARAESEQARQAASRVLAGVRPRELSSLPPHRRARPGILELLSRLTDRRNALFESIERDWLESGAARREELLAALSELIAALERAEPERGRAPGASGAPGSPVAPLLGPE